METEINRNPRFVREIIEPAGGQSLELSLSAFRKGRRQRRARQALLTAAPVVALLLSGVLFMWGRVADAPEKSLASTPVPGAGVEASPREVSHVQGTSIRIIGDEELLELLKDWPVAFVRTPKGSEVILLDEAEVQ